MKIIPMVTVKGREASGLVSAMASGFFNAELNRGRTPDFSDPDRGYRGLFANVAGKLTNFCNPEDFALATGTFFGVETNWEANQENYKPDETWGGGYAYDITAPATPQDQRAQFRFVISSPRIVTDRHEVAAFIARPRSKAAGAESQTGGQVRGGANLNDPRYGFGNQREDHSGQFNRRIHQLQSFYSDVMIALGLIAPEQPEP